MIKQTKHKEIEFFSCRIHILLFCQNRYNNQMNEFGIYNKAWKFVKLQRDFRETQKLWYIARWPTTIIAATDDDDDNDVVDDDDDDYDDDDDDEEEEEE